MNMRENKQPAKITNWTYLISALAITLVIGGGVYVYWMLFVPQRLGVLIEGEVYHCRQPEKMQWSVLNRWGIKQVISFRCREEDAVAFDKEIRICQNANVKWINIPVPTMLPTDEQIVQFIRAIRFRPGPTLFHCELGRHRTSFMKATYRVLIDQWTIDQALDEMDRQWAKPEGEKRKKTIAILKRLQDNRQFWLEKVVL